ncbi:extracellular solute-binding protein [Lacisediminihabitans profunda]|uniref:extracellular solute-binding protein n=1 Tax=Lacisediminihabitans profunda TaxID=2594790 RepID=UPI0016508CD3|nr:extracellular solute-binding protein [Lacisediminihabitans profunda]
MTKTSRLRGVLIATSIVAVGALLTACSSSGASPSSSPHATSTKVALPTGPVSLTFVGYGGAGQQGQIDAWQTPYTAAHPNVTFQNTSPASVAGVQAQVQAGNIQWDVVNVAPYAATQNCGTLFEKLSVPKLDPKDFPAGTIGECYVGNFTNSPMVAYNVKDFPDPSKAPKTIADFFNTKKFPGKRGVVSDLQDGMIEYPLLADGVKADKLYPLDVPRALKKWDTIKSDTIFAPNVGVLQQDVANDQVSMFIMVASRVLVELNAGVQIKPIWDTTVTALNAFAVPKGDTKLASAEDFIQASVQPGPSAAIAEKDGVSPINLKSKPNLSANAALVNVFGKSNTGKTVAQNVESIAKYNNADTLLINQWLNG